MPHHIPFWVWVIVGVLGITWLWVLFGENLRQRKREGVREEAPQPAAPARVAPAATRPSMVAGQQTSTVPRTGPTAPTIPPPAAISPVAPMAPATRASNLPSHPPHPVPQANWTVEFIGSLSLNRLELLVQRFWQARGCEVQRDRGPQGAIELLITRPGTGKLFALAQCGATKGDKISLATVKAFAELATAKSAGIAVYYAFAGFSDEALAFAKDKPVKLITAAGLAAEIKLLSPIQQQVLLERTLVESGPTLARG